MWKEAEEQKRERSVSEAGRKAGEKSGRGMFQVEEEKSRDERIGRSTRKEEKRERETPRTKKNESLERQENKRGERKREDDRGGNWRKKT